MAILVADCPRCVAVKMTFDVKAFTQTDEKYDWQGIFEVCGICRECHRMSVFIAAQKEPMSDGNFSTLLSHYDRSWNNLLEVEGYVSLRHEAAQGPPEHVPAGILAAFTEAATCLVVECWNAAGAMCRMCVDLATRPMLPDPTEPEPNKRTRRDLGLRLPWLFDHQKLPSDLRDLSTCIREDGNDGAHAGTLTKEDAEDLLDFTRALLERIYTEPERLKLAEKRRIDRRTPKA